MIVLTHISTLVENQTSVLLWFCNCVSPPSEFLANYKDICLVLIGVRFFHNLCLLHLGDNIVTFI